MYSTGPADTTLADEWGLFWVFFWGRTGDQAGQCFSIQSISESGRMHSRGISDFASVLSVSRYGQYL